jgi:nicotinamide-nucleotide amidase
MRYGIQNGAIIIDTCRGEHVAVGSEILLGQIQNSHARTVSLAFAEHGFYIYHHAAVGDNLERLIQVLREAAERSNVIVLTGGLGPTEDDLTREAVAQYLGRSLQESAEAMAAIDAYFVHRQHTMPLENRKQAMQILGGELLRNPNGTAPGQYVEADGVHYFLLPGPPLEMKPMLQSEVIPRLQRIFPDKRVLASKVLHFCGIGESTVDERITHLLAATNPTVAPLASEGEMLLRLTATADTESEAERRIAPVAEELYGLFRPYIYGEDEETLSSVVGQQLLQQSASLAVAESCTGGMVSSMITSIPGSSEYFYGGVVSYSNAVKQATLGVSERVLAKHGAVSKETAIEMAEGVKRSLNTTFGASVTGIAGPEGGTADKPVGLVYGAISGPQGTKTYEWRFYGSREQIRIGASKRLLWSVWLMLNDIELKEYKGF